MIGWPGSLLVGDMRSHADLRKVLQAGGWQERRPRRERMGQVGRAAVRAVRRSTADAEETTANMGAAVAENRGSDVSLSPQVCALGQAT